jgi:two-component system CheB/CheR fusion protein
MAPNSTDPPAAESTPQAESSPAEQVGDSTFPVVGIGASAGGFEAFNQLLQRLPARTGMAFVLVQHLDPTHASSLVDLLAKAAQMPIRQVTDGTLVEVDRVYVIPPNTNMVIVDGALRLTPRTETRGQHMPIDVFLQSLAQERAGRAIGVILSGTGSDGTAGLKAIKSEGGITFAQDETAKYDGMPHSAVAAGCVDFVLAPDSIAAALLRVGQHPYVNHGHGTDAGALPGEREAVLIKLFLAVRQATGVDFAPYKRGTVFRRIQRRMLVHQLAQLEDYVRYVKDHPAEAQTLYEDILIHVTSFFREPDTFETLKAAMLPALMRDRPPDAPFRVWVPGCSTGEEVYSLAIALLEFLGDKAAKTPIKIFGTDISELAIDKARAGRYLENITADVAPERLRRFFVSTEGGYQIIKAIRDLCVFARQDVTRDPPFSSMDLISCRNVLIYLGPGLQKRVLPVFHYALKDSGFLLLGSSETIGLFSDLFAVADSKHKIYSRKAVPGRMAFDFSTPELGSAEPPFAGRAGPHGLSGLDLQKEADRLVLNTYAPAGVVVNEDMEIVQSRGQTGPFLELAPGVASLNLLKMAREGLQMALRTAIDEAKKGGVSVRKESVRVKTGDHSRLVHLVVNPFTVPTSKQRFFLVLFEDATPPMKSTTDDTGKTASNASLAEASEQSVAQLQDELTVTRNYLQSIIEELEASNEELKAANEEIVSSNEELRSTNEELQTAKEELQATNEELGTVNEELRHRNREANELNNDLTNLLSSVQIPILMLGQDLTIRRFTPSAAKVMNLISTDVGRPIGDIKPRIDMPDLESLIVQVVDTFAIKEREVQDREGRWYHLSIRPYRTLDNKIDGAVLTVVDVDTLKRSEQRITEAEARLRAIVDTASEGIITMDEREQLQSFNKAAQKIFGYDAGEVMSKNAALLIASGQDPEHDSFLESAEKKATGAVRELVGRRKDGSTFLMELAVSEVLGQQRLFTAMVRDITALRQAHDRALQAERLAALGQLSAGLAHESRNALQRSQACLEMLAREVVGQPQALDLIARIQMAQDHLLKLYEEVRSYAAPLKIQRKRSHLGKLLKEVWDHLEAIRKGRNAQLRADPGNVDLRCHIDASQIHQVFRNILENALQAGSDPVEIDAAWSEVELDGRLALRIALRNNGPILTAEERQRIFEAFYTTKTHGTGLGMTIAKRIVEGHGGRMEIGAGSDQGVEILITLPRGKP